MGKAVYIGIGLITLCLGAIGAVVPILPTTPFLLIASFCFLRGSKKINSWFIATSLYKKYLESFINGRKMTRKHKIGILALATSMLLIPCIIIDNQVMRIGIGILLTIKWYYFLFIIKTY